MRDESREHEAFAEARHGLQLWQQDRRANFFKGDDFLRGLLSRHLGDSWPGCRDRLNDVGAMAAGPMDLLATECGADHALPRIERFSAIGEHIEEVVFDPAYHQLGELFWSSGVLEVLAEPGHEVLAGAIAYLMDHNGEAGHACPVACTAGAIKLLQRLGSEAQKQRYLGPLLCSDYGSALRASQFVTEVQGGSDVGANACVAEPDPARPGWYGITGEKWFCSVADADLFVVSARLLGGEQGTRGLGLFLVPRRLDGKINGFALRRLKDKLGTRAMATAEIDFEGALGEPIGPLADGFRNLVALVLDTSRVHNAVASCGAMRRAFLEAFTYAHRRTAFDHEIVRFPAVLSTLAHMKLRSMAGLATTFRILDLSDRINTCKGDAAMTAARRVDVMLNKYWTAINSSRVVQQGIEVLGGNGTIEDFSVLPRLYRDTIVMESWEGSHNTLVAQVLRDFITRGLHDAWLTVLRAEVAELNDLCTDEEIGRRVGDLDRVETMIRAAVAGDGPERQHFRLVVDHMCRVVDHLALLSQASWDRRHGHQSHAAEAAELYGLCHLEHQDPLANPRIAELEAELASST